MHATTERRVHVKVTGLAVSYAFDFRRALDFVVVLDFLCKRRVRVVLIHDDTHKGMVGTKT
jgi:hypothetical protein